MDETPETLPDGRAPRSGLVVGALATLCSVLVPGTGHRVARLSFSRTAIVATALNAVAMVALAAVLAPVRDRSDLADIVARQSVFVGVAAALAILAVTRLFTAAEVAWATRPRTGSGAKAGAAVIACAVVIAGVAPLGIAADYVWQTDRAVDKVFGKVAPTGSGHLGLIVKEPVGVVGAVLPWNFPALNPIRKLGPAIAAGCSIILKPSEETAGSAIEVFRCLQDAGLFRNSTLLPFYL